MNLFRRGVALLLAAVITWSCLPAGVVSVRAAETEEEEVIAEIAVDQDFPESQELYDGYLEGLFYGGNGIALFGELARNRLSSQGQGIYDCFKGNVQQIAAGALTSTVVKVTNAQILEWGGAGVYEGADKSSALQLFKAEFQLEEVVDALLHDCPYDLYWFDKVTGVKIGGSLTAVDGGYTVNYVKFYFQVVIDWQGSGYTATTPTFNDALVAAAQAALSNAEAIRDQYKASSDYGKLSGYRQEICDLVSYDYSANANNYSTDNDPWQLIYVFDGDSSTNVVCEGYSKAFQYLCEISDFRKEVECYSVTGDLVGVGGHMWNIVSINGCSYLVDVTNSENSSGLFLAGGSGSIAEGYTCGSHSFAYDDDSTTLWGTGDSSILKLSETDYDPCSDGHTEQTLAAEDPTCTETGLTEGAVCSVCGAVTKAQETVPATGHSHEAVVTEPTCTEKGYTTYTCGCGDSYVDDYVDAAGHSYCGMTCSVCGAEHPDAAAYAGKVISIMGDSISTFAGYIPTADGFNLEHLARYPQDDLLTDVNETWWMQVITQLDAKLGINDSWRGATLSGAAPVTTGTTGENAAMSNLVRIQNLGANGTPDIILVYGGTNDLAHVSKVGTFSSESAPAEVDLTTTKWDNLADGFVHTILRMQHYYPDAQIVALLPTYTTSYYSNEKLAEGNAVMAQICQYYEVPYVDLRDCGITTADLPDGIHPNAAGMDYITGAVLDAVRTQCEMEVGENKVYSVSHNLSNAGASKHYFKGISSGSVFEETITGDNLTVTVTMGGVDVTETAYADGKISISNVTGDIVVTAKAVFSLGDRLLQLPEKLCAGLNLWTALEHDPEYYTASGWGVHSSGKVYSVTIPVKAGDRLWATSFQAGAQNGSGSTDGIRVTYFSEDGMLRSLSAAETYNEFTKNGYLAVPDGANAVNIPMWTNEDSNELYILNLEHSYKSTVTPPTCTEKGYTTHTCSVCGDSYVDSYVDATGEHSYGFRVTFPKNTVKGYTDYACSVCGDAYQTAWLDPAAYEGKTLAAIGDSITCGVGVTANQTDYVYLLAQQLGMDYIRLGASGTTLCTDGSRTCNIGKLTESNLAGADVVTILMGINDFCNAKDDYYTLGDITSTDSSTIYGAVRMWCENIRQLRQKDSLADTQFYFVTPLITSWNNSVSSSKDWDQSKTNIHGYTLRDLCNAIVEVCALYDVPVIDLNLTSGLYYVSAEDNNTAMFGGDGVHPGVTGHEMMADALEDALLQNELRDDHSHAYGSWITTDYPSCKETGTQMRVCAECRATESKTQAATGHSYESVVTAPTCTEKGYTTHTCTVCGDSYVDSYTEATGVHSFVDAVCEHCGAIGGSCGENLTWTLVDGVLTISGTGDMKDYSPDDIRWHPYTADITYVRIADGVTSIGTWAFSECSNMTGVTIPDSVTDIGYMAFSECSSLTGITIPEGVTKIDTGTFSECDSLSSINIPKSVTSIGYSAFNRCTSLKNICFEGDAPEIAETAFAYVTATAYYSADNSTWTEDMFQNYNGSLTWIPDVCKENHTEVIDEAVNATCTTTGLTEGKHCSVCGEVLVAQEVTEKLPHPAGEPVQENEIAASCKVEGSYDEVVYCSECGEELSREAKTIEKQPHTVVEDAAVNATCTATGLTAGSHCSVCGEVIVAQEVTEKLPHTDGETVQKNEIEASCKTEGSYDEVVYCYECGEELSRETKTIEKLPHTVVEDAAVGATCTATGLTAGSHCSVCGEVIVEQDVTEKLPHSGGSPGRENEKPASCKAEGSYDEVICCIECGEELSRETKTIEKLPHTVVEDAAVGATCTTTGLTEGKHCSVCGEVLVKQEIVPETGHSFGDWKVTIDATCTEKGEERRDCANCDHFETREIAAKGHTEVIDKAVEPTCTEPGKTEGKHCSVCGTVLVKQNEIPAKGHSFGAWKTTTDASCTEKGVERRDCANCDHFETREVAAKGHVEVIDEAVDATCTETGLTEGKHCSVCNTVLAEQTVIAAKGHLYESEITEPTCVEPGFTTYTCTVCGDSYLDKETEATGEHTYLDDKDETCEICGFVRKIRIETTPMYRLYNPNSGEHFYTGSIEERDMLDEAGWNYEGIAWNAPVYEGDPVHRVYNPNSGDHHYTMSWDEVEMLVALGWQYENVAWNSASSENLPLYRLYNPNADCGSHHYTGSEEERDNLVEVGWHYEGIGWYGMLK